MGTYDVVSPTPAEPEKEEASPKSYAIFVDYRNLLLSLVGEQKKLKDLQFLESIVLKQGKGQVLFAFVFIPHHEISRAPVQQISNIFRYDVVVCPQQVEGGVIKDADTVDAHMERLARRLIERSDVTDIVIVSGDADFYGLVVDARRAGKNVTVVSGIMALSSRFRELEGLEGITIKEI